MAKTMHLANSVQIVTVDSLDVVAANLSDASEGSSEPRDTAISIPDTDCRPVRRQTWSVLCQPSTGGSDGSLRSPQTGGGEEPGYRIPGPNNDLWHKIAPDSLMTAQEIIDGFAGSDRLGLVGDGLFYHRDQFETDRTIVLPERYWSPRAANVWRLGYQKAQAGRFDDPLALTPFYLRGPEVTLRKKP